jgi:hypothetical protein
MNATATNLARIRRLGTLPADKWIEYVELSDGNVWTIDTRSGRMSNCGAVATFRPERWRINLDS